MERYTEPVRQVDARQIRGFIDVSGLPPMPVDRVVVRPDGVCLMFDDGKWALFRVENESYGSDEDFALRHTRWQVHLHDLRDYELLTQAEYDAEYNADLENKRVADEEYERRTYARLKAKYEGG